MRRGEVWWVAFDPSIGSEIRKTRPAIIVSNDIANHYLARAVVLPLTSNADRVYPGETRVSVDGKISKVMADQIMAADKIRLRAKIGELSSFDLKAVEDALALHLGLALKS
ncbi:type II toxin-antitoxin system PemK/MazF family toxin [Rhizobium sp. G21]|uniref:type II toxin-antitoxin system PemK/MazF family toxin n=1 Tax=Rhizobium sp. G21 TaxID=2758439 RepID=UPI0016036DE6|nr:type II toxin-antitoxin system PemK/MazF family toxin [Rhizobium sp. G21]MBB1250658.1 type II toxin-antitoxin system PemK/MazF family toxin [Rhizobium sp. G21]